MKILSGFASDLAKKSGGSPDNFRRDNITGSHGRRNIFFIYVGVKTWNWEKNHLWRWKNVEVGKNISKRIRNVNRLLGTSEWYV